jgi:hypothetical protein
MPSLAKVSTDGDSPPANYGMTWLYSGTILLSSCLLFLVQPMCAKMLLPLVGGTPMAWNTCMVFFQAGLLCGYAYAHAVPSRMGTNWHALLHLGLLLVAYFLLPIRLPSEMPEGWHPVAWLLASLTLSVGLPFVLLAAGAPLIQRWFVTRYPQRDPYFLYAASNFGSFLALGLFPFVLEPYWPWPTQSEIWKFGFLAMTALLAFCVPMRIRQPIALVNAPAPQLPFGWQHIRWIVLAMVPSSLLLSVTTHLTTDVAAIPLLWLIPMGLYLLTFTIVFAQPQWMPAAALVRWLPLVVIVLLFVMLSEATQPMPLVLGMHLFAFFWLALVCHGELSRTRPAAQHLTIFYLCLALGGVLGGTLNALIAPLLFPGLYEYPLMIILACVFGMNADLRPTRHDWLFAAGLGATTVVLILFFQAISLTPGPISVAAMFGVPLIVCYAMNQQARRFTLGLAAILLASGLYHGVYGVSAYRERSYFGIHRVTTIDGFHRLVHGDTIHGQQSLDPEKRGLPLAYYSTSGPIGDVFHAFHDDPRLQHVGLVGLGTGSLAAYSQPGQDWTFFEIDPSVKRIAENPKLFTYLRDAHGKVRIDLGDARLRLKQSQQTFGLLVVDAFGSDAIPVHLLTREALDVYLGHLEPNGILAFHISNHYIDLEPVLANLAADRSYVAYLRQHEPTAEQKKEGIMASHWLVIARRSEDLPPMLKKNQWQPAKARPDLAVWTDDFSNLFHVFRWRAND